MGNRDDVTGVPRLDPSFGCHILQVPGPFLGGFLGGVGTRQIILDSDLI